MVPGWLAILTLLAYLTGLFVVAHLGDTWGPRFIGPRSRGVVYALSLCVYCSSWTFFGSVGLASSRGIDFLPIYIGPILVFGFFNRFVLRIVRLGKAQNITSIADFVAARYGKSGPVAALVTLIAVVGVIPYIALQLKAISASLDIVLGGPHNGGGLPSAALPALVGLVLAGFAIAFGTRRLDATEHHDGLILAVAAESIVKLVSFLLVGAYVTWGLFDGLGDLTRRVVENPAIEAAVAAPPQIANFAVMTLLAACAILLLPRQFHVAIVENREEEDVRRAAWVFPLYIVALNLFVVPLAIAGLSLFPAGSIDRDLTVLALPMAAKAGLVVLTTLIGGFSAASAMVIVGSVALAIMVSNELVMPLALRVAALRRRIEHGDVGAAILAIRRCAILVIIALAYLYFHVAGEAALASIGLLSFACIAQIAPAFLGGLFWSRATARGALAGLLSGAAVWAYTLFIPSLDPNFLGLGELVANGPLGIQALRPTALFGLDMAPLVHGTLFSLAANCAAFVGFSLMRQATPLERLQANVFVGSKTASMAQSFRLWRGSVTVGELETTVARYLGAGRSHATFASFLSARDADRNPAAEADVHLLRFAEHLIASAIGAASSRLVLSNLLQRRTMTRATALQIVDEVSAEIQHHRDLLQYALDFAQQGMAVFDSDLRLTFWNRAFRDLFDLPSDMMRMGIGLEDIIRFNAERGLYGVGPSDEYLAARLEKLLGDGEPLRLHIAPFGRVLDIRSVRLPGGGLVSTYTDATAQVESEEELEAENETLERRVRERTEELVRLNAELAHAKAEAEDANVSKTRFLAAASHDILQPLNAARLYASSLTERVVATGDPAETLGLVRSVDASLEAVEDILTALLDISRLDAGAMRPEATRFHLDDLFRQLELEFVPLARERGLRLTFVPCTLTVFSDRRLLRRLLQNLVSNAIKYTQRGRVLVGVRRTRGRVRVEVWDTGIGIAEADQKIVFREFERLAPAAKTAAGVGLGLSIVERLSRVLGHEIALRSSPGRGSMFAVVIPRGTTIAAPLLQDAPPASGVRGPLASMVVAAIDNEPEILKGMAALLGGWGCVFVGGADHAEVDAALRESGLRPDAIIADYHLDEGSGLEAVASLRHGYGAHLPAVLVTADRGADIATAAGASNVRVLNKPLKPAALRALLSQWRLVEPVGS